MPPSVTPMLTHPSAAAATLVGDEGGSAPTRLGVGGGGPRGAGSEGHGRGAMLGRYIVLETLGRGGMGIVYAAYDPELDRKVALKLLLPGRDRGASARARLLREAQAIARLSHPNVVAVHDVGTVGEQVFIAMELVEGMDLGRWRTAEPRTYAEILGVFLQAGAGLAAAHAADLVHRDFKPENVLVGRDGRARVVDFGLVRKEEAASSQAGSSVEELPVEVSQRRAALDEDALRTVAGVLLGTPAYMSPEQFHGLGGDARTDQFSYCVSLYEALYGERPFAGESLAELAYAVTHGELRAVPSQHAVPGRLRQVLLRGLAVEPAQRYASMEALMAAVRKAATPRRGRWIAAGLVALGSGVGLLVLGVQEDVCAHASDRAAQVWSAERKEVLRERFEQTGRSYAADTWQRVEAHLDGYTGEWAAQAAAVCEGSRGVEAGAGAEEPQQRCLGERMDELDDLLTIFAAADAAVVTNAASLVHGLASPSECSEVEQRDALPVPGDPVLREQVDAVRAELRRLALGSKAGLKEADQTMLAALVERSESLGYAPLVVDVLDAQAETDGMSGDFERAAARYEQAFELALASRHDIGAFRAAVAMIHHYAVTRREPKIGLRWASRADALCRRIGDDRQLRLLVLSNQASAYGLNGDDAEAQASYDEALAIARELGHEMSVATIVNNVGAFHAERQRLDLARRYLEEAAGLNAGIFGPDHPTTLRTLANLGVIEVMGGRFREGRELLEDVLVRQQDSLGSEHPELVVTLEGLAAALGRLGELGPAEALRRRVLESRERTHGPDSPATWMARSNLAATLLRSKRHAEAHAMMLEQLRVLDSAKDVDPRRRQPVLEILAITAETLGNHREALGYVDQCLALCESVGCQNELEINMRSTEGAIKLALGDREGARRSYESAIALPRSSFEPAGRIQAQLNLARLLVDEDREAAVAHARRALAEATTDDEPTREVAHELQAWLREHG